MGVTTNMKSRQLQMRDRGRDEDRGTGWKMSDGTRGVCVCGGGGMIGEGGGEGCGRETRQIKGGGGRRRGVERRAA